jgi:hypothetical protein
MANRNGSGRSVWTFGRNRSGPLSFPLLAVLKQPAPRCPAGALRQIKDAGCPQAEAQRVRGQRAGLRNSLRASRMGRRQGTSSQRDINARFKLLGPVKANATGIATGITLGFPRPTLTKG